MASGFLLTKWEAGCFFDWKVPKLDLSVFCWQNRKRVFSPWSSCWQNRWPPTCHQRWELQRSESKNSVCRPLFSVLILPCVMIGFFIDFWGSKNFENEVGKSKKNIEKNYINIYFRILIRINIRCSGMVENSIREVVFSVIFWIHASALSWGVNHVSMLSVLYVKPFCIPSFLNASA